MYIARIGLNNYNQCNRHERYFNANANKVWYSIKNYYVLSLQGVLFVNLIIATIKIHYIIIYH